MPIYVSINGKAKAISKCYIGVSGKAVATKSVFYGINGTAKQVYSSVNETHFKLTQSYDSATKAATTKNNVLFLPDSAEKTLFGFNGKFVGFDLDKLSNNRFWGVSSKSFADCAFFSGGASSADYVGSDKIDIYTDSLVHITDISLDISIYKQPVAVAGDDYIIFARRGKPPMGLNKNFVKTYMSSEELKYLDTAATSFGGNAYFANISYVLYKITPTLTVTPLTAISSYSPMLSANNSYGIGYDTGLGNIRSFSKNGVITLIYKATATNTRGPINSVNTNKYALFDYKFSIYRRICLVDENLTVSNFNGLAVDASYNDVMLKFKQYIVAKDYKRQGYDSRSAFAFNLDYLDGNHIEHKE